VTSAFNGGRHAALVLKAVAGDAAGEQFALFIDELEQKVCIFVVDVLDPEFAEAAVFFALESNFRVAQKFYVFARSGHMI